MTKLWWLIPDGGVTVLGADESPTALGQAPYAGLSRCRDNLHHPADDIEWKNLQSALLRAASIRSWRGLQDIAKCVGVSQKLDDNWRLEITPYRVEGAGFEGITEKIARLDSQASEVEFGRALIAAFENCEGKTLKLAIKPRKK